MSLAEEIRTFVQDRMIEPARAAGRHRVEICARDVIRAMRLRDRTPAICSALDAAVFATQVRAEHITRSGPRFGATAHWELTLAPAASSPRMAALISRAFPIDDPPSPAPPGLRVSPAEFLDDMRRKVIRLVRILVSPSPDRVTLGERVWRLVEAKRIPFVTGKLILCLLAIRNRVVYDDQSLTDLEFEQVRAIAAAIESWARDSERVAA